MGLSNNLRPGILRNSKTSKNPKTSWNYYLVLSPPPKMKILSVLEKQKLNFAVARYFTLKLEFA